MREDIRNLRNILSRIHEEHSRKTSAKFIRFISNNRYVITSAAASMLILVLIGSMFIFNGNKSLNSDQLFDNFYQEEDAVMISRSNTTSGKELQIKDALLAYQGKDYETAIENLYNPEK